jgi:hypothetical protein
MSWRCNNYTCSKCAYRDIDRMVKKSEQDSQVCPECTTVLTREWGAPSVMEVALPDGTFRGVTYQKMKEAARLEKQAASLPVGDRGNIKKEIRSLRRSLGK